VAEKLVFGEMSTGAQNDLEVATNLARKLGCEYGMSDLLGPRTFGRKEEMVFLGREISEQKNYSEKMAEAIDEEIRRLIEHAHDQAVQILTDNRHILDLLSAELIKRETLEGEALDRVFLGLPVEDPAPVVPPPTPPPAPAERPERPVPNPRPRLAPGSSLP
jgi:cell division protease FtsH